MPNAKVETVALMGVPISSVTMDQVVDFVDSSIREGGFHQVATANVDFIKNAIDDPEMQQILFRCDLVVPDGMPLLWIAKLLNCPLPERVTGVDMVPRLAELSVRRGYRIYLLGASEQVSQRAAENLEMRYPGLKICGRYSPPVSSLKTMDHADILRRISDARPDILLVAFGSPKQEKWISMHRNTLQVPVCMGVGGSLDFIAGAVPRAPVWMRGSGLEWVYRCSQEPRRLTKRYVSDAAALAFHVPQQFVTNALQTRSGADSKVVAECADNCVVISVHGNLRGKLLQEFVAIASLAVQAGMNVVVNFSATTALGIDTLGELVRLNSRLTPVQRLWLTGIRPHQVRVLQGAKLDARFMIAFSVEDAMNRAARARQRGSRGPVISAIYDAVPLSRVQQKMVLLNDMCRRVAAPNRRIEEEFSFLPVRASADRVA